MITPRRVNLALKAMAVVLVLGAVMVVVAGSVMPLQSGDGGPDSSKLDGAHRLPVLPALVDYQAALNAPLRQSLDDLPPASDAPQPPVEVPADGAGTGLTLVGTIGDSLALLRFSDGAVTVHALGDRLVNGMELVSIQPAEVQLRAGSQVTTLRKPPPQHFYDHD
jgi:hypothetical protein